MKITRNKFLACFSPDGLRAPAEWSSRQAKRLYDAGLETEADGSWLHHVLASIKIAERPVLPHMCAYGTPPAAVESRVRRHVAKMRAEADLIERTLAAYGADAFTVSPAAVTCPVQPADAEPFLLALLRSDWTHIFVNGVEFVHDASGAAIRKKA